jgi:hypothetical protein
VFVRSNEELDERATTTTATRWTTATKEVIRNHFVVVEGGSPGGIEVRGRSDGNRARGPAVLARANRTAATPVTEYRKNAAAAAATENATVTAVQHVFGGVSLFSGLIRVVWLDG